MPWSAAEMRAARQAFQTWLVGMSVATPTIAVFQALNMLKGFRNDHLGAPHPDMPCRGLVVVRQNTESEDSGDPVKKNQDRRFQEQQNQLRQQQEKPPLRLLVIGDSLAAGVGMTKSVTPILPEAIGRALSKGLGGRAVSWTCMGTPGNALAQVHQEMYQIDEDRISQKKLIVLKNELKSWWELRTRRLEEEQQTEKEKEQQEQLQMEKERQGQMFPTPPPINRARRWWRRLQKDIREVKEVVERTTISPSNSSNDQEDSLVEEPLQQQSQGQMPDKTNGNNVKSSGNSPIADIKYGCDDDFDGAIVNMERDGILTKSKLLKRNNTNTWIDPSLVTQYDVTVVVTGLNDLKSVFLPQDMMRAMAAALDLDEEEESGSVFGMQKDLSRSINVLKNKISRSINHLKTITDKKSNDSNNNTNNSVGSSNSKSSGKTLSISSNNETLKTQKQREEDEIFDVSNDNRKKSDDKNEKDNNNNDNGETRNKRYYKLIVFPAFPFFPPSVVPLSWFLFPLCSMLDYQKKMLAQQFPGKVVFVEMLESKTMSDYEAKRGTLWEAKIKESVLFQLTDIKEHGRERLEKIMMQYYENWLTDVEREGGDGSEGYHELTLYSYDDFFGPGLDSQHYYNLSGDGSSPPVGSSLINVDKFHPSDEGYEIWGRKIAEAILKEWDRL